MKCPKCKQLDLKTAKIKGSDVRIDFCGSCKGFWLDEGELEQISEYAIKELGFPADAERTTRPCPKCKTPMRSMHYPQTLVELEMCQGCRGLWFDAGELKELEQVRKSLKRKGEYQEYDDIRGIKGALLQFVDDAIAYLQSF